MKSAPTPNVSESDLRKERDELESLVHLGDATASQRIRLAKIRRKLALELADRIGRK